MKRGTWVTTVRDNCLPDTCCVVFHKNAWWNLEGGTLQRVWMHDLIPGGRMRGGTRIHWVKPMLTKNLFNGVRMALVDEQMTWRKLCGASLASIRKACSGELDERFRELGTPSCVSNHCNS